MNEKSNEAVIQIEGLNKSFGELKAVDNLNLSVMKGEIFGFLGPNGAGKTTSISILCGLIKPDSGTIRINGGSGHYGKFENKKRIGLCPQETVLWELLTCREQMIFIAEMYGMRRNKAKERADLLLEKMGLVEKRNKLSRTLSGGMKRRLNIAMALVHDPEIVILDEPEAGLDPQSRLLIRDFIRSLAPEKTVIFTSHNMDEVERICHRVGIIDHGKLLALDTVEKLKQSAGEGDLIELTIAEEIDKTDFETKLKEKVGEELKAVTAAQGRFIIRVIGAAHHLPGILEVIKGSGIVYSDIAFRWNTLEDVFINLTGRSLRQ
jgi:ABC-2 type transport system ATP-binding protein